MDINKILYNALPSEKIKINHNKNPIKMDLFLSFLTANVTISRDHLGSGNGWTLRKNEEIKLSVMGGIVNGCEYLDYLKYGTKMQNSFNDYVNPFAIFDILTDEGKCFFADYYKDDIDKILESHKAKSEYFKKMFDENEAILNALKKEIDSLTPSAHTEPHS